MSTIRRKAAALALALGMFVPAFAFADTTSAIQALLDQIKALQAQIVALQQQQQSLVQQQQQALQSINSQLEEGSVGDQVSLLQRLLAMDPSIYPEKKVTGFFGRLTREAVKRFQKKHGLGQSGRLDARTIAILNMLHGNAGTSTPSGTPCYAGGFGGYWGAWGAHYPCTATSTPDSVAPVISNVTTSGTTATGTTVSWNTNENATSQVEYGTTASYGSFTSLNTSLISSHSVALSGLVASTGYHYRVWSKDSAGNTAVSPDMTFTTSATSSSDTTPPSISSVASGSLSLTGATVTWTTNEGATSQVEYGTTNAYGSLTAIDNALVTSHSVALTGLASGTTYHYRVWSKDGANNSASSGDSTFVTVSPDTTAPVISGVSVSGLASTTAAIGWNTNENANASIYWGTANPLVISTASMQSNASLATSHSFNLTGLTASSTYYYVLVSADASGNTATTTQASFATTSS